MNGKGSVAGLLVLALVALALSALLLPAAGGPVLDTVTVSFQPFQSNGPLFIADKEGYFAEARIRITWVPLTGSAQIIPGVVQGQIAVGATSLSPAFFNAVARGAKVRIVADKGHVAGPGTVGSLIVRRDLAGIVRGVADLRDRKIAYQTVGGLAHYAIYKALAGVGLSLDQITLVLMPLPASIAALQSGAVDASGLPVPLDAEAIAVGVGYPLLDMAAVIPGEPTGFLFYGPPLLEQRPELGARFLTAYLRGALQYIRGPTPRNVAIIAEYTKIDAATIRKAGWVGIHRDGFVDVAKVRRFQDFQYDLGLITVRNPMNAVVDPTFLEQARAQLGIPGR